jgi:hypothetical protein
MTQLFANNATSTLAASLTNVATSFAVATGEGARFPNPSSPDFFRATLFQVVSGVEVNHEVIKVTARATDTFTVVRGQDGTTAKAFNSGDPVQLRFTSGDAYNAVAGAPFGFTYSPSGSNNIVVAAGGVMDSTNAFWLAGAAMTKDVTSAWAAGTAAGGLDTGTVGNNEYYLWAIMRPDTGAVDYLFSLSATAPTMPTNYTVKKLIGWFRRVAAVNLAFHTYEREGWGLDFAWDTPRADLALASTLTTTARLDTLSVPTSFSVLAHLLLAVADTVNQNVTVTCPDAVDIAAGGGGGWNIRVQVTSVALFVAGTIRTSSSGQIRSKADVATIDAYNVQTNGFTWARRN